MTDPDLVIAMTVNNRPEYLRRTLASWEQARGVEHALFLFCCEPGSQEAVEACQDFRAARRIVLLNEQRLGVLVNPLIALTQAFGYGQDFAVLAEEDMEVSTDALDLLRWMRDEYRDQPQVLAASLHSERTELEYQENISLSLVRRQPKFLGWTWGIWKDRFDKVGPDWDTTYEHRGWDHRLTDYWCGEQGMTVAAPDVSRVQHIGQYGGVHCTPDMFEGLLAPTFKRQVWHQYYTEHPA